MKIENWDSGVDFYVCTPFYIVSNLYKRRHGTLIAPMPIKLIEGTMAQLGKKYLWQVIESNTPSVPLLNIYLVSDQVR